MSLPRESARDFSGLRVGPDVYRHRGPDELDSGGGGLVNFLDRELVAGFTVLETILGVVAILAVLAVLRAVFSRRPSGQANYEVRIRCRQCGWSGVVGRYNRTCKGCGGPV